MDFLTILSLQHTISTRMHRNEEKSPDMMHIRITPGDCHRFFLVILNNFLSTTN